MACSSLRATETLSGIVAIPFNRCALVACADVGVRVGVRVGDTGGQKGPQNEKK